jgi:hypothetical protein
MRRLQTIGWRGVVPHFRGCSGEPNRLPRAYHSGDYAEVSWMLAMVKARLPAAPLYAVGVSLGGSALLNWLGREQERARSTLVAAAAVSAPLDLAAAGTAIGQGFNRIYALHFLSTLVPKALAMARRFRDRSIAQPSVAPDRCTRSTMSSPRRCMASTASTIIGGAPAASPGSAALQCRHWCSTQKTIRSFLRPRCPARSPSAAPSCWSSLRTGATRASQCLRFPEAWSGSRAACYNSSRQRNSHRPLARDASRAMSTHSISR